MPYRPPRSGSDKANFTHQPPSNKVQSLPVMATSPPQVIPVMATPLCRAVVRKLNELYKSSVASCRSLSARLERFFSRKHRLMDQISSITAERLLFSHTVQMVSVQPVQRSPVGSRLWY